MHVLNLVILLLLPAVKSEDDCPSTAKSQLAEIRLRRHLLCDYDKYVRPVFTKNQTVYLKIGLSLKYFQFDMHDNSFTLESWMNLYWRDLHLTWKPEEYDSLEDIRMPINDIWIPDLSAYNKRIQGGEQSLAQSTICIVEFTGNVTCVPSISLTTTCTHDLTKYPFDTHSCYVYYGSWTYTGEELKLDFLSSPIDQTDLIENGEWKILKSDYNRSYRVYGCCPNSTYPIITIHFEIERIPGAHIIRVILPAIALVIITLTSFWIAPDSSDRLNLCYINFIAAFLYVQYITSLVPMKADTIPLILFFARDSLLLSTFTIIFSLILKYMVKNENPAPLWMSRALMIFKWFKLRKVLLRRNLSLEILSLNKEDGNDVNVNDDGLRKKECMIFAQFLDRLCFLVFLVLYSCMFVAFTP
ncbi:neuronal acetylcholine receptor subunit alpha-5-like [Zophobas morio]|uniref:neuronal acetylcholine receptor subunit alpha-5-like n=1 Tax=Zophobas morio TaxID=2755281 RepID=UPI00308363DD